METQNLLKQFYEENLERDWGVKYDSLTTNQLRLIEKTFSFTFWKASKAGEALKNAFLNIKKSAIKWTENMNTLNNTLTNK